MHRKVPGASLVMLACLMLAGCSARVDTHDTDELCTKDCELLQSHACNPGPKRFPGTEDCIQNCEVRLENAGDCELERRDLYECRSQLTCQEYGPALDPDDESQPCFEESKADSECSP